MDRLRITSISGQWVQIAVTVVVAAVLTVLLTVGMRRANELQASSSALQLATALSMQPQFLRSELTLMQRGLESRTYVGESLRSIQSIRDSSRSAYVQMQQAIKAAGLDGASNVTVTLAEALRDWQTLDKKLNAIGTHGDKELYADTVNGSELTPAGRQLMAGIDGLLASEARKMQDLGGKLRGLGTQLHGTVASNGNSLRTLLLGGTAVAALLLALMLYYAVRGRASAARADSAQRQVTNILDTVREGLFLVGRDLRLGATCSRSLSELLRTPSPAGQSFEDILRPLTDQKTAAAGLKFLALLWKDNVNDDLVESINPLNQIEVSFSTASGGTDVRYLAFSFRRVRGADAAADHVLGVVTDVTDRVLLARELQDAKSDNDFQSTLLLQLMRVDPAQLTGFLSTTDVALRKANAMLTAPGIGQDDLKNKLNGVFRELHAVKGEAAALGIASLQQRVHEAEDILSSLRVQPQITGNDFVPVVVRIDDLMTQLATLRSMHERVSEFQRPAPTGGDARSEAGDHISTTIISKTTVTPLRPRTAYNAAALPGLLKSLVKDISRAEARSVRIECQGMGDVPEHLGSAVKDICIQMVRNAIVHGIEPPEDRLTAGKSDEGMVKIGFASDGNDAYMLTLEDDGRGLSYENILDKALRAGIVQPHEAATMDALQVFRLIFRPGFSTVGKVSENAGRGVGLDVVSTVIKDLGARIGVSTTPGKYTRFRIRLPKNTAVDLANSSTA